VASWLGNLWLGSFSQFREMVRTMTMAAEKAVVVDKSAVNKDRDSAQAETAERPGMGKTAISAMGGDRVASAAAEKALDRPSDKPTTDKRADRPGLAHDKRRALGRGLESLLPGPRGAAGSAGTTTAASVPAPDSPSIPGDGTAIPATIPDLQAAARRKADGYEVIELALDLIDHNPYQTRMFTSDDEDALFELSESIRANGVIQPITVRRGENGRYLLVAGERRVRASRTAERKTIPAIVRTVSEQQAAEMTVIENLQRADLNCMEQARAYIMLSQDFGLTQEQIGERVGVSRESVSNYMRLAKLPELVQRYLLMGQLEFSHARALLNLQDPEVMARVAHKAATENWSVDKLENFVLFDPSMFAAQKKEAMGGGARWVDPNVRAAQRKLEEILGVKVRIRDRKGKGKITLEYATLEDFDRVLGMLTRKT
jgi:ParB family chromosome partitioning protein